MDSEHWLKVWRSLAFGLLRDGYYSLDALVCWAKQNGFPLPLAKQALDALDVEPFEHNGERYWRLSGKVAPLVPREVRIRAEVQR
jgi:hypothetical protein